MAMAKIFVTQIKRGAITLDDVSAAWRKEVEKLLESEVV